MLRSILGLLFATLLLIYLSSTFLRDPINPDNVKLVNPAFELSKEVYTNGDSLSVELHYKSVIAYLKKPYFQNLPIGLVYRQDEALEKYYDTYYIRSEKPELMDLGNFMQGLLYAKTKRMNFAEKSISAIKNQQMDYLPFLTSFIKYSYGEYNEAKKMCFQELTKHKSDPFGIELYVAILYETKDFKILSEYLSDETQRYYSKSMLEDVYYYRGDIFKYYVNYYFSTYAEAGTEIVAAFLVAFLWLFYLYKVNTFTVFSKSALLLTVLFSALFTEGCLLVYQFYDVFLNFTLTNSFFNDLFYCILGIGLIEEMAKIIPLFLIVFLLKRQIKDPFHLLLIASISAITFSFLENILYFKMYQDQIVYIRAMISSPIHIFCSTLIAFGSFTISKEGYKFHWKRCILFFLYSICFHGLFDFILLNPGFYYFRFLSYFFVLVALIGLVRMYNFALNFSPNFKEDNIFSNNYLKNILIIGFTSILLLEFINGAIWNGHNYSYDLLMDSTLGFLIFLGFLITKLSEYTLVKGFKTSILSTYSSFPYDELLNNHIQISQVVNNKSTDDCVSAQTFARLQLKNNPNYIHCKVDGDATYHGYNDLLLVPNSYVQNKIRRGYYCKTYALLTSIEALDIDQPNIKLLHTSELLIKGSDKPKKPSLFDRINSISYFILFFIFSLVFAYYMNYKSARTAYKWALPFLEKKTLSSAGGNFDYAIAKDNDYTDAYIMSAKIDLYVREYESCLNRLNLAQPYDSQSEFVIQALRAKCYLEMGKIDQAIELFKKIVSNSTIRDTATFYLAKYEYSSKDPQKAIQLYEERFPNTSNDTIIFSKVQLYYKLTKYRKVLELMKGDLTVRRSNYSTYHYWSGMSYLNLDNRDSACYHLLESEKWHHNKGSVEYGIQCYGRDTTNTME